MVRRSKSGKENHWYKHGEGMKSPLYRAWRNMVSKCRYDSADEHHRYKARGITVCPEWEHDYLVFKNWALASGYRQGLTIERKDNDLGYNPENCTWVTLEEQANNRTNNRWYTIDGVTKNTKQWAEEYGVPVKMVYSRIYLGWDIKTALTTPKRKQKYPERSKE